MNRSNKTQVLISSKQKTDRGVQVESSNNTQLLINAKSTNHTDCLINPVYKESLLIPTQPNTYIPNATEPYLKVDNYLSEFNTKAKQQKARQNLGIDGLAYWGNIEGLLENQQDLVQYINQVSAGNEENFTNKLEKVQDNIQTTIEKTQETLESKLGALASDNIKGGLQTVNNVTELNSIPEHKLQLGMLAYVTSLDMYYQYNTKGWEKASFNSSGIPMYTQSMYDGLTSKPDDCVIIRDPYPEQVQENLSYLNVLFSAIRSLQAEVAKLKNSFKYGINSYTETATAMSQVMDQIPEVDNEPLWALEEDSLSQFMPGTIAMDSTHKLQGDGIIVDNEHNLLTITQEAYFQDPAEGFNRQQDPKSIVFITTTGKNVEFHLKHNQERITVNLTNLPFANVDLYNILVVVSKKTVKTLEDPTLYGQDFLWIQVTDAKTNKVLTSGYYNGSALQNDPYDLGKQYYIEKIYFRNLVLSKLNSYTKAQDFSYNVIPSIPNESDYKLGVAHLTIRSVSTPEVLDYVGNQLQSNELIWVESTKSLCIKSQGKIYNIGGNNKENTMTTAELISVLESLGIIVTTVGENQYNLELADLSGITFIHQETGKKFDICVDSDGNIKSTPEVTNLIKDRLKNISNLVNYTPRGFLSRLRLSEDGGSNDKDAGLKSDRLKIGAIYAPIEGREVYGCSHAYIELENTSDQDIALNDCFLHVAMFGNTQKEIKTLALKGTIPAGGTFLIRGKQYAKYDDVNTVIKVKTFDQEWYDGGQLIDFQKPNLQFLLVYNLPTVDLETDYIKNDASQKVSDTVCFNIKDGVIDGAWVRSKNKDCKWFSDDRFLVNDVKNKNNQDVPIDRDYILKNTFELDPAKQAFQALCPCDSSRLRGTNKNDFKPFYIDIPVITFPNSDPTYDVSLITPKASFEHKNVSTDKTKLNTQKPNMVTCAFGINMHNTRCFNWISVGSFDEYIWIRQKGTENWSKFESYKTISEAISQGDANIVRKEFTVKINNAVYARMQGRFPGDGSFYTAHKCIVQVPTPNSKTTYEYVVGRADISGNMDEQHISEIQQFTVYPLKTTPKVYHITDQQGFYWLEYQTWAGSAKKLAKQIEGESTMPVIINTGDVTQNGTRINEWLDYYLAGYDLFKQFEHMSVVGNNDLCGTDPSILGTGDDTGKSNGYYHHLFNCYEIDTEDLVVNGKYVPSTYYFECTNPSNTKTRFINLNSEITFINCRDWFGLNTADSNIAYNIYTGWTTGNTTAVETPMYTETFTPIYNTLYQWLNCGNECIVACHEIPFTVMTRENMSMDVTYPSYRTASRSIDGKKGSLVGSHLNQLTKVDNVALYWFSRLLEHFGVRICLGGHKHTYTCTYPVREFYLYENGTKNSLKNGPITMNPNLSDEYANGEHRVTWNYTKAVDDSLLQTEDIATFANLSNGKYNCFIPDEVQFHTSRLPLVKFSGEVKKASLGSSGMAFGSYTKNELSSLYLPIVGVPNLTNAVIYFMCQATGYKQTSNKELPGVGQSFSSLLPLTQYDSELDKDTASSWQQVPMFGELEFSGNTRKLYLARIMNIQSGEKKPLYIDTFSTKTPAIQYIDPTKNDRFGDWTTGVKNPIATYEV